MLQKLPYFSPHNKTTFFCFFFSPVAAPLMMDTLHRFVNMPKIFLNTSSLRFKFAGGKQKKCFNLFLHLLLVNP